MLVDWGEGEQPDNAEELWQKAVSASPGLLNGVHFSVLALGDTSYVEVFRGGDDPRTVNWRIWNRGNVADSFEISFDHFSDVSASAVGLNDGKTPYISPGESHNLTVRYSFGQLTFGDRTISMTATSVLSQTSESPVSGTGNADFQVGAQGWITLNPPGVIEIREGGNDNSYLNSFMVFT